MEFREATIKAPWGNIALLTYGNPIGEPVLLVHGRLDSASTFVPLLKLLPSKYHYVCFDMPGNGKSDSFPKGIMLSRFIGVMVIDLVVQHFGWKEFVYIGHSLGAEQGLFYASIYPKKVKKAIYLDIGPSLEYCKSFKLPTVFKGVYENYYDNYNKYDYNIEYTKEKAVRSLQNARSLNEEEAELVLSRNLIEIGPDTYKLSWDRRYKIVPSFNSVSTQFYLDLFSQHPTPSFFVCANDMKKIFYKPTSISVRFMTILAEKSRNVKVTFVDGGHDVHLTNPERFIKELLEFLDSDFVISKL